MTAITKRRLVRPSIALALEHPDAFELMDPVLSRPGFLSLRTAAKCRLKRLFGCSSSFR